MASMKEKLDQYWQLRREGVSAPEAAKQVWPDGMPSAQEYQEKQQQEREKSARTGQLGAVAGQTVGTIGGAYLASKIPAAVAALSGTGEIATPTLLSVGAPSGAAAGGAGTTAGASTLGSAGSVALPAAAVVAALSETWEGGAKDILRGRGNKQDWANMGANATLGVGPNLVLRWLGKPSIGRMMTSGKSDAQLLRDDFRGDLRSEGIADQDYNVTLADGSKFNIGLDGKTKYQNVGQNIDGKTERNAWDVDFSNPLAEVAIGEIDPHIRSIYKEENGVKPEQYTGLLVNAALSNAKTPEDVKRNVAAILGRSQAAQQPAQPQMQNKETAPVNNLDEMAARLATSFSRR